MTIQTEDKKNMRMRAHAIYIENRERVSITGVQDVESFNDEEVVLQTEQGMLRVLGTNMHIVRLNLEEGQLIVNGFVSLVEYEDQPVAEHKKGGGFFSRLLR